jgi:phosphoribosylanthranilate isomerase
MRGSTRIKICGLSTPADVDAAVAAGADALGFNFFPRSRRFVAPELAGPLAERVPPFVARVGLFVDPSVADVEAVLQQVRLHYLQFHGDEDDAFCARFGVPYLKALGVSGPVDGAALAARFPRAVGILLDATVGGISGGTGTRFDWSWFPRGAGKHWILAGGLDATNVGEAIARLRPHAVDVSSGVESAPGRKDAARMAAFCDAVRAADAARADDVTPDDSNRQPMDDRA